jgi:hypothetical protein
MPELREEEPRHVHQLIPRVAYGLAFFSWPAELTIREPMSRSFNHHCRASGVDSRRQVNRISPEGAGGNLRSSV